MPGGGARRGRRDNGLVAAEYAVAGDVDPRVGEHLLDVLAAGGIAAYLQPSSDLHPVTRTASLPARPTDRLYVDRAHVGTARNYLREVGAEADRSGEPDIDAAWREIVAGYDLRVDPTAPPWPAAEDVDRGRAAPTPAEPGRRKPERHGSESPEPEPHRPESPEPESHDVTDQNRDGDDDGSLLDALDGFGADLPDDDNEGYTPPPPPPLPRLSHAAGLGIAAIVAGLTLFIWPYLLPLGSDTVLVLGFACVVVGFGTLIWRLRSDEDDDAGDDGARV